MNNARGFVLRNKRVLLVLALCFVLLFGYLIVRRYIIFSLTSSYPANNGVLASSSERIVLNFNKALDKDQHIAASLRTEGRTARLSSHIDGKTLYLFGEDNERPFADSGKYSLRVAEVKSDSGSSLKQLLLDFTVSFEEFKNLPKAEQERQISESSSFEDLHPINKKLPFANEFYTIESVFPDTDLPKNEQLKPTLYIYMNFAARGQEEGDNPYTNAVRKYRKEALKQIEAWNYKPSDFLYKVGEGILLNEFSSYYPGIKLVEDVSNAETE